MDQAIELFADEQYAGFFDTSKDHETLISRPKDIVDNATPAGNSVAMDVLSDWRPSAAYLSISSEWTSICNPLLM